MDTSSSLKVELCTEELDQKIEALGEEIRTIDFLKLYKLIEGLHGPITKLLYPLANEKIKNFAAVCNFTRLELRAINQIGDKSLDELEAFLEAHGMRLVTPSERLTSGMDYFKYDVKGFLLRRGFKNIAEVDKVYFGKFPMPLNLSQLSFRVASTLDLPKSLRKDSRWNLETVNSYILEQVNLGLKRSVHLILEP